MWTINTSTNLLYSQASSSPWEPLYEDRPQVSLPQAGAVHQSGQSLDLSGGALSGLVEQLDNIGLIMSNKKI